MRTSKFTAMILISLMLASTKPVFATHEGTWHGGDRSAGSAFCAMVGAIGGAGAEKACLSLV